ncbi:MAG: CBS domain-containing protein [Lysobacter sp.]|nr:CBS domain-containing protein [Lysobacter sp.]
MRTVRQLLDAKAAAEVFAIGPDAPVIDAIRLMAEKRIGAVLVMEGSRLAGILSERDYARKIVLQGRSSADTPVRDIMTAQVVSVSLGDSAERCMQIVTERRIRHLPVLEGGEVIGVVSIGDLVKAVIEDQQVSKGPATATVSADGEFIAIQVPERTIELSVADVFGMQKTKFDKAIIVAQGHRGDRYDVLLRAEAPSDPKQDGGRCAKGREVSMRHIAFDTGSTTTSSSSDFESCLDRLRVVAERREPDGRLEYDLKQGHEDGSESDVYLHYETVDFKKSINF